MFNAILNAIAERSQALKDKDAEIATWSELAESLESSNTDLRARGASKDERLDRLIEERDVMLTRIGELKASTDRAYAGEREANARASVAESQLLQIAEALDIEPVVADVTPEAEAVEEVAAANEHLRKGLNAIAEELDAKAEEPATEG